MKLPKMITLITVLSLTGYYLVMTGSTSAQSASSRIGERPALEAHINQSDIENGAIRFKKLLEIGGVMHGVVLKWNEKK